MVGGGGLPLRTPPGFNAHFSLEMYPQPSIIAREKHLSPRKKEKKLHGECHRICGLTKGHLIKAAPVQKVFLSKQRVSTSPVKLP